jgi:hypothetical protein
MVCPSPPIVKDRKWLCCALQSHKFQKNDSTRFLLVSDSQPSESVVSKDFFNPLLVPAQFRLADRMHTPKRRTRTYEMGTVLAPGDPIGANGNLAITKLIDAWL